jgi:hypothetical protein
MPINASVRGKVLFGDVSRLPSTSVVAEPLPILARRHADLTREQLAK